MSRFKKFLLIMGGVILVSGSTAFAITATDFYQEAASYSYQHCRAVSDTDRLANTICFLLKNQSDNQIQLALQKDNNSGQQSQISNLAEKFKQPKLYDGNNNLIGIDVSIGDYPNGIQFFNTDLNHIVRLRQEGTLNTQVISFSNLGCTGESYYSTFDSSPIAPDKYLEVIKNFTGHYYVIDTSVAVSTRVLLSYSGTNGDCTNSTHTGTSIKVNPITLPFSDPVTLPISLKYE